MNRWGRGLAVALAPLLLGATWTGIKPYLMPGKVAVYSFATADGTGFSSIWRHECGTLGYGFEDGAGGDATIQSCSDATCTVAENEAVLTADADGTFVPRYPWLRVERVATGAGTSQVFLRCGPNVAVAGVGGSGDEITVDGAAASSPVNLSSAAGVDPILCTGVGAPDASCLAAGDVVFIGSGGGGDNVSIDGVAATDPDFRAEGDADPIRCTGAGAPDARCVAAEDVIYEVVQADALEADAANCGANEWAAGVSTTGAAQGCTADDDVPDAGEVSDTALAAGAVDGGNLGEIADASITADDLAAASLTAADAAADLATQAELDAKTIAAGTDNAIARQDGAAGDLQDSSVTIDDTGNVAVPSTGSVDVAANATAGGAMCLKEDSDLGVSKWCIDIAATNLTGFSITPNAAGLLNIATLLEGSSANLRTALSDETGTGLAVFADGAIGAATATTAAANDNDTSVATTAFVQSEIDDGDLLTDNCVLENDATPIPDSCVGNGTDDTGAGGGDAIRVEDGDNGGTFTAMTDADLEDSGDINFVRAAGAPDAVSAEIRAGAVGTTEAAALDAGDVTTGAFGDARVDGSLESDEVTGLTDAQISDTLTASTSTTAAANDNDTSISTTAFVQQEIDDGDNLTDNCIVENDSTPIPDSCVGDGTDGGGGGNSVEVTLDFGASGSEIASVVVTGQAWVASGSEIICAPTMVATADRAEAAEDAVIEGLVLSPHTRAAGTGFTLTGAPRFGIAFGKYAAHCTGV